MVYIKKTLSHILKPLNLNIPDHYKNQLSNINKFNKVLTLAPLYTTENIRHRTVSGCTPHGSCLILTHCFCCLSSVSHCVSSSSAVPTPNSKLCEHYHSKNGCSCSCWKALQNLCQVVIHPLVIPSTKRNLFWLELVSVIAILTLLVEIQQYSSDLIMDQFL